jgi:hypothetical protein
MRTSDPGAPDQADRITGEDQERAVADQTEGVKTAAHGGSDSRMPDQADERGEPARNP